MSTPKTTTNPTVTPVESPEVQAMRAEMAKLMAQNEALRSKAEALEKAKRQGLSYKVSEKGALSVYGMGRFPVTLYAEQWATLFENKAAIEAFIEANKAKLPSKAEKQAAQSELEKAQAEAERKARIAAYEASKAAAKVG